MVDIPVAHDADIDLTDAVMIKQIRYGRGAFLVSPRIDKAGVLRRHYQAAVTLADIGEDHPAGRPVNEGEHINAEHYGKDRADQP